MAVKKEVLKTPLIIPITNPMYPLKCLETLLVFWTLFIIHYITVAE